MITEVALITLSCVLFIQMGLADAICNLFRVSLRIVTCPKCLTFWSSLAWTLLSEYDPLVCVAASFIASYAATWLALLYDSLALIYNHLYEQITKPQDTSTDAERPRSPSDIQAGGDEVSQM